MTKSRYYFLKSSLENMEEGLVRSRRPKLYKDGRTANSKYITGAFMSLTLKRRVSITTLRPTPLNQLPSKRCRIYQDQSNSIDLLEDKYNVHYWKWLGSRTAGRLQRYGAVVKKHDITNKNPQTIRIQLESPHHLALGLSDALRRQKDFCHVLSDHAWCAMGWWRDPSRCDPDQVQMICW